MDYTCEMQRLVKSWYEKKGLNYRSAGKIAGVNHMTVHKLVNENAPFKVRAELLKKFSKNTGLDLGFDLSLEEVLPVYTAVKRVGEGLSLKDTEHYLNKYALNNDYIINIDKGWAESSALVKLNDESLSDFRNDLALVHILPVTHYGINGSSIFFDLFSSGKSFYFISLNGVKSVKMLSVEPDKKVYLHVTNDEWAEKNNYQNNRRLVRSDEKLTVYGKVIGSVLILEETIAGKVKDINESVDITKVDHLICAIVAALLGALGGLGSAQVLTSIL